MSRYFVALLILTLASAGCSSFVVVTPSSATRTITPVSSTATSQTSTSLPSAIPTNTATPTATKNPTPTLTPIRTPESTPPRAELGPDELLTLDRLEAFWGNLPIPPQTQLAHQIFYGCQKNSFAGGLALYSTDESRSDIYEFYKTYFAGTKWSVVDEWAYYYRDNPILLGLNAISPQQTVFPQQQSLILMATDDFDVGGPLAYPLEDEIRRAAKVNGKFRSGFTIHIIYTADKTVTPHGQALELMTSCQKGYWELKMAFSLNQ